MLGLKRKKPPTEVTYLSFVTGSTMVMIIPQFSHRRTMRSLVSVVCIATEQIGQAFGGTRGLGCCSIQPMTAPNDLCGYDLDQIGCCRAASSESAKDQNATWQPLLAKSGLPRWSQLVDATPGGQLAINNDDGLPNARPIAFGDSPRNQLSHNTIFSAAPIPLRSH